MVLCRIVGIYINLYLQHWIYIVRFEKGKDIGYNEKINK